MCVPRAKRGTDCAAGKLYAANCTREKGQALIFTAAFTVCEHDGGEYKKIIWSVTCEKKT